MRAPHSVPEFDLEPRWLLAFSALIPSPFSVISQKVEMIPIKFTNGPLKGRAACDGGKCARREIKYDSLPSIGRAADHTESREPAVERRGTPTCRGGSPAPVITFSILIIFSHA